MSSDRTGKRIKPLAWILLVVVIVVAIVWDILIICTNFSIPTLYVSDTYIDTIFTTLCTVATLSSAILSLVIGAFTVKMYGFNLREIISKKLCPINVRATVGISLAAVIIAIFFYACNFCTTVTAITFVVVICILKSSYDIWEVLTNDRYVINAILENDVLLENHVAEYFNRWYLEFANAIEANDELMQERYLQLIKEVVSKAIEKNYAYQPIVERRVDDIFTKACIRLGFVDAYHKLLCLNDWKGNDYVDSFSVLSNYYKTIQFSDSNKIVSYRIVSTVEDIAKENNLLKEDRIKFIYMHFHSIMANANLEAKYKYDLMNEIVKKLTCLYYEINGEVRGETLLYIFRDYVLNNEDQENRKEIFFSVLKNLSIQNPYNHDLSYISVIAQIFRAIYFYCEFEVETLLPSYRNDLRKLFASSKESKDVSNNSLNNLIEKSAADIINWLIVDAIESYDENFETSMFDYFPEQTTIKTTIWTGRTKLDFAFCYYCVAEYKQELFFNKGNVISLLQGKNYYESVLMDLLQLFDEQNETLNKNATDRIRTLSEYVDKTSMILEETIRNNYQNFNSNLEELIKSKVDGTPKNLHVDYEEINKELYQMFAEEKDFVFDEDIPLSNKNDIQIRPKLILYIKKDCKTEARIKYYIVREVIKAIISDVLPYIKIGFDLPGVKILLGKLKEREYTYRNFSYIYDGLIKEEVKASADFKELKSKLDTIEKRSISGLDNCVFLNVDNVKFNVQVVSWTYLEPSNDEIEEYIKGFKIADGKYRIGGVVRNTSNSIEWVRTKYRVEHFTVRIATNITNETGFIVNYDWQIQ